MHDVKEKLDVANYELYECYNNSEVQDIESIIKQQSEILEKSKEEQELLNSQNAAIMKSINEVCQDGYYDEELVKKREEYKEANKEF